MTPGDLLTTVPPPAAYPVITALVVLESVLFLGPFVPTLGLLLVAGGLAYAGTLTLPAVIACAAAGAVLGDFQAHWTGHRLGDRLRTGRVGRRIPAPAWDRAHAAIRRRGRHTLLICRFLPLVRTLAPHAAGAAGMPYRRLAPFSATAGVAWACTEAGIGYAGAASWSQLPATQDVVLTAGAVAATLLLALGIRTVVTRRRSALRPFAPRTNTATNRTLARATPHHRHPGPGPVPSGDAVPPRSRTGAQAPGNRSGCHLGATSGQALARDEQGPDRT